jgi:integrating conjugative element protein (TIGR03757 family)
MSMKRSGLFLLGMLALPAYSVAAGTESNNAVLPQKMEVFSSRALPVTGLEQAARLITGERLKIYDLDAVAALEREISVGLPADQEEAKRLAAQRMSTLGPDLALRFARAYQGVIQARRYGLTMYPAVVFDGGQSVIYGETDLATALEQYHLWKTQRGSTP